MKKHYTDSEIATTLKGLTIIIDRREQVNGHITSWLDKKKIPYINRKLDVGDYACQIGDMTFEQDFAIEKKNSLDEIAGNLGKDRDRFEREFIRAKANNTRVLLLIEDGSWEDILAHNYRSELSEKSFYATLMAWQAKYPVSVNFCRRSESPMHIYSWLMYSAKQKLLSNSDGG